MAADLGKGSAAIHTGWTMKHLVKNMLSFGQKKHCIIEVTLFWHLLKRMEFCIWKYANKLNHIIISFILLSYNLIHCYDKINVENKLIQYMPWWRFVMALFKKKNPNAINPNLSHLNFKLLFTLSVILKKKRWISFVPCNF